MTPTNDQVATVLEKAADLYESEQIEWCTTEWARPTGVGISACAEGAILLASGHSFDRVWKYGQRLAQSDGLARAANDALLRVINEGREFEGQALTVYSWNDRMIGGRVPVYVRVGKDTSEVLSPPIVSVAKAEIIEKMKAAAKDLRNA